MIMDSSKAAILILGLAIVTFIPRVIPALLMDRMSFGPKTEKFLRLIPYTALAALIFPGVLSVDSSKPIIGIVGVLVAALLAWRKQPVMVCVPAAIAAVFILYLFI